MNLNQKTSDIIKRREFIKANRTAAGGWTREFLSSIGVAWPPLRNWQWCDRCRFNSSVGFHHRNCGCYCHL